MTNLGKDELRSRAPLFIAISRASRRLDRAESEVRARSPGGGGIRSAESLELLILDENERHAAVEWRRVFSTDS